MAHLYDYIYSFGYLFLAIIIFFIGKVIYQMIHPKINVKNELVEKDNLAFSITLTGYYAALVIVIGSAIVGESQVVPGNEFDGFLHDLFDITLYSFLGIALLNISSILVDKFILAKFDLNKEIIDDQNAGAGIIKGVAFVSIALILFGSITGESGDQTSGIITACIYWLIGMVVMMVMSKVYGLMVNYDIHKEIEKDNVAAGLAFAGSLLAISIIVMNALMGDFNTWLDTLLEVGTQTALGLIMLPIMRFVSDKIFLPGQKLTDEIVNQKEPNIGAGLIEAFAYVGSAILITWSL